MARHDRGLSVLLVILLGLNWSLLASVVPATGSEQLTDAVAYLVIWAAVIPVYFRTSHPLIALWVSTALTMVYWVLDYPYGPDPTLYVLFYCAVRYGGEDRRTVWRAVITALAVTVMVAIVGVLVPTEDLPIIAVFGIFMSFAVFAVLGEVMFQRARNVTQLEQRAAALEADMESKAALAAVEERSRIAREMHDVVAHGLSAVVVQSQAAQNLVETDPDRASEVLETIERIGRDSVNEMRRLLGVLRHDEEVALQPQPTLRELPGLLDQASVAGVDLTLEISGEQRLLSPGVELTGYRIVQEALTNVLRHAGRPVNALASVHYDEHAVTISITDDGLGAAPLPSVGAGHGISGMRERIAIYDGELIAGALADGGYRVEARLPVVTQTTPVAAS